MTNIIEAEPLVSPGGIGWTRAGIAERVSRDIARESFVNLGIGIPQLVLQYFGPEDNVFLHSENGIIGLGPVPSDDEADFDMTDAGKRFASLVTGGSVCDSEMSFAIIRGGHLDYALLGGMEVSVAGDLANWSAPGRTPGVGGAMDLAVGARQRWVLQQHMGRDGSSKLRVSCGLPLTGSGIVGRVYTDLGVFEPTGEAFAVIELAPGVTHDFVVRSTEAPLDFSRLDA